MLAWQIIPAPGSRNSRQIQLVDVVLPTRAGVEIRKRCISRPTEHQAILLQRLGLQLPESLEMTRL